MCTVKQTEIPERSLVFGNFYFDYYSSRFGLGFRLGLGLGLVLRLGLRVSFFGLYYVCYIFLGFIIKMSAHTERAPSLFLFQLVGLSFLLLIKKVK